MGVVSESAVSVKYLTIRLRWDAYMHNVVVVNCYEYGDDDEDYGEQVPCCIPISIAVIATSVAITYVYTLAIGRPFSS
jgi:hypothetical protein